MGSQRVRHDWATFTFTRRQSSENINQLLGKILISTRLGIQAQRPSKDRSGRNATALCPKCQRTYRVQKLAEKIEQKVVWRGCKQVPNAGWKCRLPKARTVVFCAAVTLGLCRFEQALSSCGKRRLPSRCDVQASLCNGFSGGGARASGTPVVLGGGLRSSSFWALEWAQQPGCSGGVALRHVESSSTGDQARVPLHWPTDLLDHQGSP